MRQRSTSLVTSVGDTFQVLAAASRGGPSTRRRGRPTNRSRGSASASLVRPKSQSRSVFGGARRVRELETGGRAWFRSREVFRDAVCARVALRVFAIVRARVSDVCEAHGLVFSEGNENTELRPVAAHPEPLGGVALPVGCLSRRMPERADGAVGRSTKLNSLRIGARVAPVIGARNAVRTAQCRVGGPQRRVRGAEHLQHGLPVRD